MRQTANEESGKEWEEEVTKHEFALKIKPDVQSQAIKWRVKKNRKHLRKTWISSYSVWVLHVCLAFNGYVLMHKHIQNTCMSQSVANKNVLQQNCRINLSAFSFFFLFNTLTRKSHRQSGIDSIFHECEHFAKQIKWQKHWICIRIRIFSNTHSLSSARILTHIWWTCVYLCEWHCDVRQSWIIADIEHGKCYKNRRISFHRF